jgi:hypothetical protein
VPVFEGAGEDYVEVLGGVLEKRKNGEGFEVRGKALGTLSVHLKSPTNMRVSVVWMRSWRFRRD